MSFIVISIIIGGFLIATMIHSISQRSPVRVGVAFLGLVFLVFAVGIRPSEPTKTQAATPALEDFGDAAFKEFYNRYSYLLGAPVGPAMQYKGALSQWFKYGRLEFKQDGGSLPHPDFPKLTLAPVGEEALQKAKIPPSREIEIPAIVEGYLASKERDDFYADFKPLQPAPSKDSPLLIQNFGEAQFRDFYDRYSTILGEAVSPAGIYKGFPSQWFQYGRVELHNEYDAPLHPLFPKLQMGLVGREYLRQQGLSPDPQPQIAPILERWFTDTAGKQDILYFYGNPLTNPKVDQSTGFTSQYFERSVFSWPSGSQNPGDVFRLSVGLELFNKLHVDTGLANDEKPKEAFRRYFFGAPLTNEILDKEKGLSTMYFERAVFQWPTGSKDPTEVRQLPVGANLYSGLEAALTTSPWASPLKVFFLTLGGVTLIISGLLTILMQESGQVYGRL